MIDIILITLKIVILFVLPANILLLLFLRLKVAQYIRSIPTVLLAYGASPLLNALLFYYGVWLMPSQSHGFYIVGINMAWFIVLLLNFSYLKSALSAYRAVFTAIGKVALPAWLFMIGGLMVLLFFTQSVLYPVAENDSAAYLNQSEAIYQNLNISWRSEYPIIIRGDDIIHYNTMIRPAIPHFMAYSFLYEHSGVDDELFRFLIFYYYILLGGLFVYLAVLLARDLNKSISKAAVYGSFFFLFTWEFAHSLSYNLKESIIYFFILFSLFVLYKAISLKEFQWWPVWLLGLVLGLNAFINLHGIIIACFILLLFLVLSKQTFRKRLVQVVGVLVLMNILGGLEFMKFYLFTVIYKSVKTYVITGFYAAWEWIRNILPETNTPAGNSLLDPNSSFNSGIDATQQNLAVEQGTINNKFTALTDEDEGHLGLYQFSSGINLYLRGKLQVFTNLGVFGIYVWAFAGVLATNYKRLFKAPLARIILLFMALYFVVIIDIFSLNPLKTAVILSGSTKYAGVLLLCSLLFVSVYGDTIMNIINRWIDRYAKWVVRIAVVVIVVLLLMRSYIVSLLTSILLSTIPVYKEVSYYEGKMEQLLYLGLIGLGVIAIAAVVNNANKKQLSYALVTMVCAIVFIVAPFFAAPFGKLTVIDTPQYVFASKTEKLQHTLFHGDEYQVYNYAKEILPQGSTIMLFNTTLFSYDDYFTLVRNVTFEESRSGDAIVDYVIMPKKCPTGKTLHTVGNISLCTY